MHLKLSWVSTHLAWMEQGLGLQKFCSVNKRIITQNANILTKDKHVSNSIDGEILFDMWSTMKGKLWQKEKIERSSFGRFLRSK